MTPGLLIDLLVVAALPLAGGPSEPRALAPQVEAKLGPFVRRAVAGKLRGLPPFVRADREAGSWIRVQTGIEPGGDLAGFRIRGRVGSVASLELPLQAVPRLAAMPQVRWLRAARSFELMTDVSTGSSHVRSDQATAQLAVDGNGVLIAIFDTGIDWTNEDFRNPDGTTRIAAIWDQTISDPTHGPPAGFDFGAFYSRQEIDDALESSGGPGGGSPLVTVDVHGHGTHVAGTAAGTGARTGGGFPPGTYAGVAPGAELLILKVFEGQDAVFCEGCDLVAGVEFAQRFAATAGKPWVMNMSIGGNLGPHDGTSSSALAVDAAIGPGLRGAHAAIAAGNSGSVNRHFHWEGQLTAGTPSTNGFLLEDGPLRDGPDNDYLWLDLWYAGAARAAVAITTPGSETVTADFGEDSGIVCTDSGAIQIDATNAPDALNGDNQVFVQIWDSSECDPSLAPEPGSWSIEILPAPESVGGGFDLWNQAATRGQAWVDLDTFSLAESLTRPGTSRHALTAAAYVAKESWLNLDGNIAIPCCSTADAGNRSVFSGLGPTRDGRLKPDIAAPGEWVASSIAIGDQSPPSAFFTEADGEHHNIRGTSMATPHVAGTVALLFQLNPQLDAPHVDVAVSRAAFEDEFTGGVPNLSYGHGKLRALEAGFEAATIVTDLRAGAGGFTGTDSPHVDGYNLYRGELSELPGGSYGSCLVAGLPSPDYDDTDDPPLGEGFFYLFTGTYGIFTDSSEGTLGTDSEGDARINSAPCTD